MFSSRKNLSTRKLALAISYLVFSQMSSPSVTTATTPSTSGGQVQEIRYMNISGSTPSQTGNVMKILGGNTAQAVRVLQQPLSQGGTQQQTVRVVQQPATVRGSSGQEQQVRVIQHPVSGQQVRVVQQGTGTVRGVQPQQLRLQTQQPQVVRLQQPRQSTSLLQPRLPTSPSQQVSFR